MASNQQSVVGFGIFSTKFSRVVNMKKNLEKFVPVLLERKATSVMMGVYANPYVPRGLKTMLNTMVNTMMNTMVIPVFDECNGKSLFCIPSKVSLTYATTVR